MTDGILVLDLGTTELKAVLYDERFRPVDDCSHAWSYRYPAPHRIEHPADSYWTICLQAMHKLLSTDERREALRAISVTGQAETLIALDASGAPLGDAIVWLDTRAQAEATALGEKIDEDALYRTTGNAGFDPVMPACKIPWMRAHEPERYRLTETFLLIKEYIVYCLSGQKIGECSALSCSGYFDIVRRAYDPGILAEAGIDPHKLPEPMDSLFVVGPIASATARALDISPEVQIVNGMLDQCASAIGAGNLNPGVISETTGTVLAIAATADAFLPETYDDKMLVLSHAFPDRFLVLPNCPTAGVLLNWFRDQFLSPADLSEGENAFELISRKVSEKPVDENGLLALPHFSGRLSPVHAPHARGVLYGLSLNTDKYDIARALMESVGFLLRENLELLARNGITSQEVLSLGGGAKSATWMRIKADICQKPMVTVKNLQTTALGCALGAGVAIGLIQSLDELSGYVERDRVYAPDPMQKDAYDHLYSRYLQLHDQLGF